MSDVLAISLRSMQQDMGRLERISLNLANAATPGYKREVASAIAIGAGGFVDAIRVADTASMAARSAAPTLPAAGALMVLTDARPGTLKTTGQSLDVALATPGYFEVSTDAGPAYTRQGTWQLDPRGRVITAQGHPVMGVGGEIVLTRANPVIDATGQVFEVRPDGGREAMPVAQLKVVNFERTAELKRIGESLVTADEAPTRLTDPDVQLKQGFLENSNVNSMQEMAQLVQSMRHFESMQKVALGYDEMIGNAVRKLGELS